MRLRSAGQNQAKPLAGTYLTLDVRPSRASIKVLQGSFTFNPDNTLLIKSENDEDQEGFYKQAGDTLQMGKKLDDLDASYLITTNTDDITIITSLDSPPNDGYLGIALKPEATADKVITLEEMAGTWDLSGHPMTITKDGSITYVNGITGTATAGTWGEARIKLCRRNTEAFSQFVALGKTGDGLIVNQGFLALLLKPYNTPQAADTDAKPETGTNTPTGFKAGTWVVKDPDSIDGQERAGVDWIFNDNGTGFTNRGDGFEWTYNAPYLTLKGLTSNAYRVTWSGSTAILTRGTTGKTVVYRMSPK